MEFDFQTLVSDINKKYPEKRHPRVIMTDSDFARIKDNSEDPIMKKLLDKLKSQCESLLTAELPRHHIPDGIRLLGMSRRVQDHIISLCLGYNVFGDERYADRAYKELEAAAGFPDWNHKHFLDPSEMALAFAIGYDWLFYWLDDKKKEVIRYAVLKHGILQSLDDYEDRPRTRTYRWYQHMPGDNWKMVCNGGMSSACLAILDEVTPEQYTMCEKVLTFGHASTKKAVQDFYSEIDGDYVESLGYWEYATNFLAFHSSALMTAAGSDYGLTDWDGIRKTPYFILQMCGNTSRSFNFGDGGESIMRPTAMLWLANLLNDPKIASVRIKAMENGSYAINDLLYYRPGFTADMEALDKNFGGVGRDNATFRSGWGDEDVYCGIHFGRNSVCHAHLDTGTFILEYAGERFFIDLGADNYNLRPYSGSYRFRAEGHNTLVFDPSDKPDQVYTNNSTISKYENNDKFGYAICDMSDAYPGKGVVRGIKLCRGTKTVIVRDKIKCEPENEIYWAAHTRANIELSADKKSAVLKQNEKQLWVGIDGEGEFEIRDALPFPTSPKVEPAVDQDGTMHAQSKNEGVKKLVIRNRGKSEYDIKVAFVPMGEEASAKTGLSFDEM